MPYLAFGALAFVLLGFVAGRWWILVAPAALGGYIAIETEVDEVPHWFLGMGYALLGAGAVAAGILLRRGFRDRAKERP